MNKRKDAAWVGLGAMGAPMAAHLARAGRLSAVWNRTPEKARCLVDSLAAEGIREIDVVKSPAELAGRARVIVTCVSADGDLEAMVEALLPELAAGQVLVDHSTVSPATARSLAARLEEIGVGFLDAPVTGGVEGAENGRLSVMVGGNPDVFGPAGDIMQAYSAVVHHLGPVGAGQSAKAVNQVMVAGIAEAVCEALSLSEALELPRGEMLELLGSGAAGSWFLDKRGASLLEGRYDRGFHPALLLKDLEICRRVADDAGCRLASLDQALADYRRLLETYPDPGRDISALFRIKNPPG